MARLEVKEPNARTISCLCSVNKQVCHFIQQSIYTNKSKLQYRRHSKDVCLNESVYVHVIVEKTDVSLLSGLQGKLSYLSNIFIHS